MLGVILNEAKAIKEFKKNYVLPNDVKWTEMINLLIKYYYLKEKDQDKDKIYKCIMDDIKESLQGNFVYTKWNTMVRRNINNFDKLLKIYNINIKLFNINKIRITNKELKKIEELNNIVLEKIAFVVLIYAKISSIQMQSNEFWINKSTSTICTEAKVGLRGKDQMIAMNELFIKKYITTSKINNKTNIKVCFVDSGDGVSEDDLVITDFNDVIYQYLIWKGEKWIRCEECSKWIKPKSNRNKFCNSCWKKREKKLWRESKRKSRNNEDVQV